VAAGLQLLKHRLTRLAFWNFASVTLRMGTILTAIAVWYLLTTNKVMWPLMFANLPSPVGVLTTWLELLHRPVYLAHICATIIRILISVVLATVLAVPIGIALARSWLLSVTVHGILELLRPIPLIALIPVVTLLFPSTEASIVTITFIAAFFPLLEVTRTAVGRLPRVYHMVAGTMRLTPSQFTRWVLLPGIMPSILSGLSVAIGTAWMGVITAEIMSGRTGIGYFTSSAYMLMHHTETIVGTLTIGLLGFCSVTILRVSQRLFSKVYR